MLELIRPARQWEWIACGKHPVARDFFFVGREFPLARSFSEWVETGFRNFSEKKNTISTGASWRFWARGPRAGSFVCGLIRDSSDSLGRSYPFLVMGTGPLKGWEEQWELLPFACEKTWEQIEYLAVQGRSDLKQFENEIAGIRTPGPDWPLFVSQRERLMQGKEASGSPGNMPEGNNGFLSLPLVATGDQLEQISASHSRLKTGLPSAPTVLFMGGSMEKAHVAVFQRPLVADDFVKLWTLSELLIDP